MKTYAMGQETFDFQEAVKRLQNGKLVQPVTTDSSEVYYALVDNGSILVMRAGEALIQIDARLSWSAVTGQWREVLAMEDK